MGSFSIYGGGSSKNVRQKVRLRCFKLLRSSSITFNLSNVGEFCIALLHFNNSIPASGKSSSPPKISSEPLLFRLLARSDFFRGGGEGESLGVFSVESSRPGRSSSESKLMSSLLDFAFCAKSNNKILKNPRFFHLV